MFISLYLYGDFGDEYCDAGSVKHNKSTMSIVHDCNNEVVAELQSALSDINNNRACNDLTSRVLDPLRVHYLFKAMLVEVNIYTKVDCFWVAFPYLFILKKDCCFLRLQKFIFPSSWTNLLLFVVGLRPTLYWKTREADNNKHCCATDSYSTFSYNGRAKVNASLNVFMSFLPFIVIWFQWAFYTHIIEENMGSGLEFWATGNYARKIWMLLGVRRI